MSLPPDLAHMLSAFAGHRVRYLVIGGHAVSLDARPRTTKGSIPRLTTSLERASRSNDGLPAELVAALRPAAPDEIVWIGRVPARVDFLQRVPGVAFDAAWARRLSVDMGGTSVTFIGADDLIANKRAVGRSRGLTSSAKPARPGPDRG